MLFFRLIFLCGLSGFLYAPSAHAQSKTTDTISLNGTWKFKTDLYKEGEQRRWYQPTISVAHWDDIAVPGNWDASNEYAHYTGDAWYRYSFTINKSLSSKHIRLVFESVFNDAEVWLNGIQLGENHLGFLAFQFDVSKYLKFGSTNTIAVKVNNCFKRGALWNWGGIRRPVWLEITSPLRIDYVAIDAIPNLTNGTADISLSTESGNYSGSNTNAFYDITILYKGKKLATSGKEQIGRLKPGSTRESKTKIHLPPGDVHLWHFEHPELYDAEVNLYQNANLVHTLRERFGIRKVEVDGYKLKLNGEEIRTIGFDIVPEDRVSGNALPLDRFKTMVDMMKECGGNMARLSHVALPKAFLDYLDEKGFMTFEEVSLWGKDTLVDPANPLPKLWLRKLIRQQYNHPSVIGWSVGNEIGSFKNNPRVYDYVKGALAMAKQLNPDRLATYVSNSAGAQPNDPAGLCDIILMNSYGNWGKSADAVHKNFPSKLIFFSEYGADLNTEDLDKSSVPVEKMLAELRGKPYVMGASLWTFNDYRSNYWSPKASWSTAPSENRAWGITNSVLQAKRSYYEVKRTYQPFLVTRLTATAEGGSFDIKLGLQSRALESFPSFTIAGYHLEIVAKDKVGNALQRRTFLVPVLKPGTSSPDFSLEIPIDVKTQSINVAVIDSLRYNRFDTTIWVTKPVVPEVVGVFKNQRSLRIVFAKDPSASRYFVRYGTNTLSHVSDTAVLNNFISINDLNSDSTYKFCLVAENNSGTTEGATDSIKLTSTELPPIIWEVMPVSEGFFISYASDPLDFKYEVEYGVKPGHYEKCLTLGTKGSLIIPHLKSRERYFFRMRRLLQWGFASEWTNEMQVMTE